MSFQMQSKNSRKRAAPGAFPMPPTVVTQPLTAPPNIANIDFIKWAQNPEESPCSDSSVHNILNNYGANPTLQANLNKPTPPLSTQLARRPISEHRITAEQNNYESLDTCVLFGNNSLMELSNKTGLEGENDSVEALEERAAIAKRDALAKRKQIPPFVQKLSSFLEESRNTDLIKWSDQGDSFIVLDEDEFAKTLIPELFKHNNYASFVRQLNMYGFHKRVGLSDNSMKASERKNKSPSEYYNPYFKRGHQNLLWLITKPRGGNSKNKKKIKEIESFQIDSDDDKDVEEIFGNSIQSSRALSVGPESSLQRRDVSILHNQLAEIQQQQTIISNAIQRLRKDHNTLYQQSVAFQSLHDRHDNSINAILTFLATVYNRSLDGQNPPNIAQMFSNGIPHNDQQHPGSVVDIGEVSNQKEKYPGSMSPHRRAQLLLMAPSAAKKRVRSATPPANSHPLGKESQTRVRQQSKSSSVEEVFETTRRSHSISNPPSPLLSPSSTLQQSNMMSFINDTNAANVDPMINVMELPEMLSQYEKPDDNSLLTPEQQNSMLLLTSGTSPGTKNSLESPSPSNAPTQDLNKIKYTNDEIDNLLRLQIEQDEKIGNFKSILGPLSPSVMAASNQETDFFNADVTNSNLDLDQFLDTVPYFTGNCSMPAGNSNPYEFDNFGDENTFCLDLDGNLGIKVEGNDKVEVDLLTPIDHEIRDEKSATCQNMSTKSNEKNSTPPSPSKRRRCN
ncbi:putative heat shock transcription factor [Golovinomyces cichoracearum]|uniref:Putative heat shock transcription factor n=1 Tax=Golovinomyces cichoracearum TaxID=62708 RepID=A0A420IA13_9PEZI|nr:putative heat shock transcription factor [Golovinomyces cichoracearum]